MENIIRNEIDKMCPVKSFKVSKSRDPWVTNEILEEIRDKGLAIKKARKSGRADHLLLAKNERNRVEKLVDRARAIYFKDEDITEVIPKDSGIMFNLSCLGKYPVDSLYRFRTHVTGIGLNMKRPLILLTHFSQTLVLT